MIPMRMDELALEPKAIDGLTTVTADMAALFFMNSLLFRFSIGLHISTKKYIIFLITIMSIQNCNFLWFFHNDNCESMKKEILIVLGSPNSPTGKLSEISISRLNHCRDIFEKGDLVLCTGGWGSHFNTSKSAHAAHAKSYLIEQGLSEMDFLEFAFSENTVDDAVKIKPIVSNLKDITLTIITSDYHVERVKLIFNEILGSYNITYVGVKSNMETEKYNALVQHEKIAIKSILENGLYY